MRRVLLIALAFSMIVTVPTPAVALCAEPDPDQLSIRQMIEQGTTGDDFYRRMILGRVLAIRDPGDAGGKAIAVVAVRAYPTGWVPVTARVRFYKPPPRVWIEDNVEFHVGDRWVIVAHRKDDGSYRQDGGCGQTRRVAVDRFRTLLALARHGEGANLPPPTLATSLRRACTMLRS